MADAHSDCHFCSKRVFSSCHSADIEDISAKTGNYKKFAVFVRMLASAIRQESDSVFVDLLTYADLETLKSKKGAGRAALQRTIPPNNKRYLILTYAAEFDRVHYPLPLLYEEPTVESLQSVVQQLRTQLARSASVGGKVKHSESAAEVRRLREENSALERLLEEIQQRADDSNLSSVEQLQINHAEAQQEVALVSGARILETCHFLGTAIFAVRSSCQCNCGNRSITHLLAANAVHCVRPRLCMHKQLAVSWHSHQNSCTSFPYILLICGYDPELAEVLDARGTTQFIIVLPPAL